MIEFDSLCYLQNHKTGCSMVESFLRRCCTDDIVRYEKHLAPRWRKEGKFYFVSVREPLDTYLSLFNYGLDGKGELFGRLRAAGQGGLYDKGIDGFGSWIDFVLDPAHAALVYPKECVAVASTLGLVSFRFLRLAAFGFEQQCGALADRPAITAYLEANRLVDAVIRYETLQSDLTALVEGPLRHAFRDQRAALDWISSSPRVNASTRRDRKGKQLLSDKQRKRLMEREWFLYQTYYADTAGKTLS